MASVYGISVKRQLEKKEVEWCWEQPQNEAFKKIKYIVIKASLLQYFDVSKNTTIKCDASQYGLGSTLLQDGRPVRYANRALTSTDQNYKPLIAIQKKPISTTSKRLQRMILCLQKYGLVFTYKHLRGTAILQASREIDSSERPGL